MIGIFGLPSSFTLSPAAGLDAAPAIQAKSATIDFEKNLESDDIIGQLAPNDFNNKEFRITGTIELLYDDTTFKALALAGTTRAMRITIKNDDVIIGAAANPELTIDFAKVILTEWTRDSGQNDLIRQTLTFTAYYSQTDAKMVTAKLTNTQASY